MEIISKQVEFIGQLYHQHYHKIIYNLYNLILVDFSVKIKICICLFFFFTAMKPHEIQEKLGLTRIRDRNWYVQPSCATSGDGLYEGLTWLTSNHKL